FPPNPSESERVSESRPLASDRVEPWRCPLPLSNPFLAIRCLEVCATGVARRSGHHPIGHTRSVPGASGWLRTRHDLPPQPPPGEACSLLTRAFDPFETAVPSPLHPVLVGPCVGGQRAYGVPCARSPGWPHLTA